MHILQAAFDASPRRPRHRVVLRPVRHSVAFETALVVQSCAVVRDLDRACRNGVYQVALLQRSFQMDAIASEGSLLGQALARVRDEAERIVKAALVRFSQLFGGEGDRFDKRFSAQFSAAVADGIDLERVIRKGRLGDKVTAAAERHAALIRGITAEIAKRIETRVNDLMVQGATNELIAKALSDSFGFGLKRARFIARDQASKWNGELNRLRQRQVGVTTYVWSTSRDQRVRGNPDGRYPNAKPSHWAREGKTFRWNDPPSDGHPGMAINCRCTAKAVIEF